MREFLFPDQQIIAVHPTREADALAAGAAPVNPDKTVDMVFPDKQEVTPVHITRISDALAAGAAVKSIIAVGKQPPETLTAPEKAAEEPKQPTYQWVGPPLTTAPENLEGGRQFLDLLNKQQQGRSGFWENITPGTQDIPYAGGAVAAIDTVKIWKTANALAANETVADQDLLDLNRFLLENDREANASVGGKIGSILRQSATFGLEILGTVATLGFMAPAAEVSALGRMAASRGVLNGIKNKVAASVSKGASRWIGEKASDFVGKTTGTLAKAAAFGAIHTAETEAVQLAASTAITGEPATRQGNVYGIYAALQGKPESYWLSMMSGAASDVIEAGTEMMGMELMTGVKTLAKPFLSAEFATALSNRITGVVTNALPKGTLPEVIGKTADYYTKMAKMGALVAEKMRISGLTATAAAKWLKNAGYDGVLEEFGEERAADFLHGLIGQQGEEAGFANAFKQMIPSTDEAIAELVAFAVPMAFVRTTQKLQNYSLGLTDNSLFQTLKTIKQIWTMPDALYEDREKLVTALQTSFDTFKAQYEASKTDKNTSKWLNWALDVAALPFNWDFGRLMYGSFERAAVNEGLGSTYQALRQVYETRIKEGDSEEKAWNTTRKFHDEFITAWVRKVATYKSEEGKTKLEEMAKSGKLYRPKGDEDSWGRVHAIINTPVDEVLKEILARHNIPTDIEITAAGELSPKLVGIDEKELADMYFQDANTTDVGDRLAAYVRTGAVTAAMNLGIPPASGIGLDFMRRYTDVQRKAFQNERAANQRQVRIGDSVRAGPVGSGGKVSVVTDMTDTDVQLSTGEWVSKKDIGAGKTLERVYASEYHPVSAFGVVGTREDLTNYFVEKGYTDKEGADLYFERGLIAPAGKKNKDGKPLYSVVPGAVNNVEGGVFFSVRHGPAHFVEDSLEHRLALIEGQGKLSDTMEALALAIADKVSTTKTGGDETAKQYLAEIAKRLRDPGTRFEMMMKIIREGLLKYDKANYGFVETLPYSEELSKLGDLSKFLGTELLGQLRADVAKYLGNDFEVVYMNPFLGMAPTVLPEGKKQKLEKPGIKKEEAKPKTTGQKKSEKPLAPAPPKEAKKEEKPAPAEAKKPVKSEAEEAAEVVSEIPAEQKQAQQPLLPPPPLPPQKPTIEQTGKKKAGVSPAKTIAPKAKPAAPKVKTAKPEEPKPAPQPAKPLEQRLLDLDAAIDKNKSPEGKGPKENLSIVLSSPARIRQQDIATISYLAQVWPQVVKSGIDPNDPNELYKFLTRDMGITRRQLQAFRARNDELVKKGEVSPDAEQKALDEAEALLEESDSDNSPAVKDEEEEAASIEDAGVNWDAKDIVWMKRNLSRQKLHLLFNYVMGSAKGGAALDRLFSGYLNTSLSLYESIKPGTPEADKVRFDPAMWNEESFRAWVDSDSGGNADEKLLKTLLGAMPLESARQAYGFYKSRYSVTGYQMVYSKDKEGNVLREWMPSNLQDIEATLTAAINDRFSYGSLSLDLRRSKSDPTGAISASKRAAGLANAVIHGRSDDMALLSQLTGIPVLYWQMAKSRQRDQARDIIYALKRFTLPALNKDLAAVRKAASARNPNAGQMYIDAMNKFKEAAFTGVGEKATGRVTTGLMKLALQQKPESVEGRARVGISPEGNQLSSYMFHSPFTIALTRAALAGKTKYIKNMNFVRFEGVSDLSTGRAKDAKHLSRDELWNAMKERFEMPDGRMFVFALAGEKRILVGFEVEKPKPDGTFEENWELLSREIQTLMMGDVKNWGGTVKFNKRSASFLTQGLQPLHVEGGLPAFVKSADFADGRAKGKLADGQSVFARGIMPMAEKAFGAPEGTMSVLKAAAIGLHPVDNKPYLHKGLFVGMNESVRKAGGEKGILTQVDDWIEAYNKKNPNSPIQAAFSSETTKATSHAVELGSEPDTYYLPLYFFFEQANLNSPNVVHRINLATQIISDMQSTDHPGPFMDAILKLVNISDKDIREEFPNTRLADLLSEEMNSIRELIEAAQLNENYNPYLVQLKDRMMSSWVLKALKNKLPGYHAVAVAAGNSDQVDDSSVVNGRYIPGLAILHAEGPGVRYAYRFVASKDRNDAAKYIIAELVNGNFWDLVKRDPVTGKWVETDPGKVTPDMLRLDELRVKDWGILIPGSLALVNRTPGTGLESHILCRLGEDPGAGFGNMAMLADATIKRAGVDFDGDEWGTYILDSRQEMLPGFAEVQQGVMDNAGQLRSATLLGILDNYDQMPIGALHHRIDTEVYTDFSKDFNAAVTKALEAVNAKNVYSPEGVRAAEELVWDAREVLGALVANVSTVQLTMMNGDLFFKPSERGDLRSLTLLPADETNGKQALTFRRWAAPDEARKRADRLIRLDLGTLVNMAVDNPKDLKLAPTGMTKSKTTLMILALMGSGESVTTEEESKNLVLRVFDWLNSPMVEAYSRLVDESRAVTSPQYLTGMEIADKLKEQFVPNWQKIKALREAAKGKKNISPPGPAERRVNALITLHWASKELFNVSSVMRMGNQSVGSTAAYNELKKKFFKMLLDEMRNIDARGVIGTPQFKAAGVRMGALGDLVYSSSHPLRSRVAEKLAERTGVKYNVTVDGDRVAGKKPALAIDPQTRLDKDGNALPVRNLVTRSEQANIDNRILNMLLIDALSEPGTPGWSEHFRDLPHLGAVIGMEGEAQLEGLEPGAKFTSGLEILKQEQPDNKFLQALNVFTYRRTGMTEIRSTIRDIESLTPNELDAIHEDARKVVLPANSWTKEQFLRGLMLYSAWRYGAGTTMYSGNFARLLPPETWKAMDFLVKDELERWSAPAETGAITHGDNATIYVTGIGKKHGWDRYEPEIGQAPAEEEEKPVAPPPPPSPAPAAKAEAKPKAIKSLEELSLPAAMTEEEQTPPAETKGENLSLSFLKRMKNDPEFRTRYENSYIHHTQDKDDVFLKKFEESKKKNYYESLPYYYKPNGFWFAVGSSWNDWAKEAWPERVAVERGEWEIHLDPTIKLLKIETDQQLLDFTNKYLRAGATLPLVDWAAVARDYDGIVISPYLDSMRLDARTPWYYTWDVASGAVWNLKNSTAEKIPAKLEKTGPAPIESMSLSLRSKVLDLMAQFDNKPNRNAFTPNMRRAYSTWIDRVLHGDLEARDFVAAHVSRKDRRSETMLTLYKACSRFRRENGMTVQAQRDAEEEAPAEQQEEEIDRVQFDHMPPVAGREEFHQQELGLSLTAMAEEFVKSQSPFELMGPARMHKLYLSELSEVTAWRTRATLLYNKLNKIYGINEGMALYKMDSASLVKADVLDTLTEDEYDLGIQNWWALTAMLEDAEVEKIFKNASLTDEQKKKAIEDRLSNIMITWGRPVKIEKGLYAGAHENTGPEESVADFFERFRDSTYYQKLTKHRSPEDLNWYLYIKAIRQIYRKMPGFAEFLHQRAGYAGEHAFGLGIENKYLRRAEQQVFKALLEVSQTVPNSATRFPDPTTEYTSRFKDTERPPVTKAQKDLYYALVGPEDYSLTQFGQMTVWDMNAAIIAALRERQVELALRLGDKYDPAAPEAAKDLATIKALSETLKNYKFAEWTGRELGRRYEGTFNEIYHNSKYARTFTTEDGRVIKIPKKPRTMDAVDMMRRYVNDVTGVALKRHVLKGYILSPDIDGSPLVMAVPSRIVDQTPLLTRETLQESLDRANAYLLKKKPAVSSATLDDNLKQAAQQLMATGEYERMESPFPSIAEFIVKKGDTSSLMKHLVQERAKWVVMGTDMLEVLAGIAQWSKMTSVGFSAFFLTTNLESVIAGTGFKRNFLWNLKKNFKEIFDLMRKINAYDRDIERWEVDLARANIDIGKEAAFDEGISLVDRQFKAIHDRIEAVSGKDMANRSKALMEIMTGKYFTESFFGEPGKRPGIFKGIKLWATMRMAKMMAASEVPGFDKMTTPEQDAAIMGTFDKLSDSERQRILKAIADNINDAYGGQFWSKYVWATPVVRQVMNMLLFAFNWTLSSWNIAGGGLLTGQLFGNYIGPNERKFILANWAVMASIVMFALPNALQFVIWAAFGKGGDDDPPFTFMNEESRKSYVDITPIARISPLYKGDPTGRRRLYMRWGKQAYEVLDGWLTEPVSQLLRKLSQPAKIVLEQITGRSPGSDWNLEFQGQGLAGWFMAERDGEISFLDSRLGYIVQKFMPMSVINGIKNPETWLAGAVAPVSKGMSMGKATAELIIILNSAANEDNWKQYKKFPHARANLEGLGRKLLDAAAANGYDTDKIVNTAKGVVLSRLYKGFTAALNTNDISTMNRISNQILRVGGTIRGIKQSIANRKVQTGRAKELSEEELTAINNAFNIQETPIE